MKNWLPFVFSLLLSPMLFAATNSVELRDADVDIHDKNSLRRGATLFTQYCLACHPARFLRFNRMARDLEISDETLKTMMSATETAQSLMLTFASSEEQVEIFGLEAPDLSLTAQYRGPDWVYSYLTGFYEDENQRFGYNNRVFPNVSMPWVLYYQQEMMPAEQFDRDMLDLTNFMTYMAEPIRPFRERAGKYVLIFLLVLLIPVWLLSKDYWREIT